ncbi:YfbU family protein [Bacillus atrophaeus]|uniref:YfbU family protein n=1 Tax=Bacillus atrophaeus TaxID=1452 RepID=UPI00227FB504|nr:YfbU family protein [Bacillus atrophaeus]MCY8513536.1 YfbU family protein [Bacillus atrophaeus]MCY8992640.1 YfbU family protein [Bacillus atrophaeus]MCY9159970.1 YfbU family protein [Bacillus atrophaeus]
MTINFTKEQRAILINQMEILKRVDPQNSDEYEKNIDILYNGFSYFYSDVCGEIEDEFPVIITRKVFDILDMYRTLYFSYENLPREEQDEISERDVLFQGFDGNEESYHYSFVNYVVKKSRLYLELKDLLDEGKIELNSHKNKISYYNELLSRWSQVRKETDDIYLTLQQINTVLGK